MTAGKGLAEKGRAWFEAEAAELIQRQLLNHSDPGVRAMAMAFNPPAESIARVADILQAQAAANEEPK